MTLHMPKRRMAQWAIMAAVASAGESSAYAVGLEAWSAQHNADPGSSRIAFAGPNAQTALAASEPAGFIRIDLKTSSIRLPETTVEAAAPAAQAAAPVQLNEAGLRASNAWNTLWAVVDQVLDTRPPRVLRYARDALMGLAGFVCAGGLIWLYGSLVQGGGQRQRLPRWRRPRLWRDRDARFRDLFDGHPVPMWVHDAESRQFLAVNDAAIAQYGFSEADFHSMSIRDIYAPEDLGRLDTYLARFERNTHAGAHGAGGVWKHVRRDGTLINADLSYHMIAFRGRKACFVLANDVTDYMKVEAEVHRSNQMLESIIDNIPQRIFWKDHESYFLGCNLAFARDAGLAYTEQVIGKRDEDLPWGGYAESTREQDQEVMMTGIPKMHIEEVLIDYRGAQHHVLSSKLPLMSGEGRIIGLLGTFTDITEQKRSELALRLQSRALEASVNAIMITAPTSAGNIIEYVNPAFKRITGYDAGEALGYDCRFLQRDDRDQEGLKLIREALKAGREVSAVLRNYRKDGALFWNQLYIAPVPDAHGRTTHHISVINDVTELIQYQEQLEYQANYDALTRMPNRNLLRDRLEQALARATRNSGNLAVVFIDLDGFKNVNDGLGHSVGDKLLTVIAERLSQCARSSDTVARHGGDEFVVVLSDPSDENAVMLWMERARVAIAEPIWIDETELYVGCSMGASLFPQDGTDAETLLKKADQAMYRAKDMGRNTYQFYQPEMNTAVGTRLDLERRLRRGLRDKEFLLHYQPQVDLVTGQVVGLEALVRWQDPEAGLVSPAAFIPVAEESGLIAPLGEWVLREACRQNKAWQDAGLPPARVSVNLSARQFHRKNIATLVKTVLEETGLEPQYLELELTESAIMRNAEEAAEMLRELRALGIGLAIDDFGTGYSSLGYLKRFQVDRLKIDRSFVNDIGRSDDDETITSAIITLAHSLQLQVIAEGVETQAQLDFLRTRSCDEMQGYYFSKPVPHDGIPRLLAASRNPDPLPAVA
jgi:diguanylate cyclase (GGDEF)-like protein/PAS domain S-box-containing protein